MIANPTSGGCDKVLDLREILHKSPVRVCIDLLGLSLFWVDGYGGIVVSIGVAFSFVGRLISSIRFVRSALSAFDSPISGGFRSCALKWRSSSSLGESYLSESLPLCCSRSIVVVSLRFGVCSSVEEAWEGLSLGSGLGGTCFSVVVLTVHSWALFDIVLNVCWSAGVSFHGTAALAS